MKMLQDISTCKENTRSIEKRLVLWLKFDLCKEILSFLDTLEVKDLELTWEDMRELYIIFAEVDTEIEFCKTNIQAETLGYYKEVLKRFKAQKGE